MHAWSYMATIVLNNIQFENFLQVTTTRSYIEDLCLWEVTLLHSCTTSTGTTFDSLQHSTLAPSIWTNSNDSFLANVFSNTFCKNSLSNLQISLLKVHVAPECWTSMNQMICHKIYFICNLKQLNHFHFLRSFTYFPHTKKNPTQQTKQPSAVLSASKTITLDFSTVLT